MFAKLYKDFTIQVKKFCNDRSMSKIDLAVLANPDSHSFFAEISTVHIKSQTHQPGLFRALLGNFDREISEEAGNAILVALCKILSIQVHTTAFIRGRSAERLPFSRREFSERLFDLLHVMATNCPNAFTEPVIKQFSRIIDRDAYKSLYIIALFAKQLNNLEEPWAMVDLLFRYEASFTKPKIVENYISLLVFLCCQYPHYRKGRASACWTSICNILASQDPSAVSCAYNALSKILEISDQLGGEFPMEMILDHITIPEIQPAVLSFLLRYHPPASNSKYTRKLVSQLLSLTSDMRAWYLLIKMAGNESIAKMLISRPQWMLDSASDHAVKLFTAILSHTNLRSLVVETDETIDFLKALVDHDDPAAAAMLCCFIRRMPLTKEFVQKLSNGGVIAAFADHVANNNDKRSALLLYDTLGRVSFISDFVDVCPFIVATIKQQEDPDLIGHALTVACLLAGFRECANEFVRLRIHKFLPAEDPALSKQARRILHKIKAHDQDRPRQK